MFGYMWRVFFFWLYEPGKEYSVGFIIKNLRLRKCIPKRNLFRISFCRTSRPTASLAWDMTGNIVFVLFSCIVSSVLFFCIFHIWINLLLLFWKEYDRIEVTIYSFFWLYMSSTENSPLGSWSKGKLSLRSYSFQFERNQKSTS